MNTHIDKNSDLSTSVPDKSGVGIMCKCLQCKANFPEKDITKDDALGEVCPVCKSSEWCYKSGSNLLELTMNIELICNEDTVPSELRHEILSKVNAVLQGYQIQKVADVSKDNYIVCHVPF